MMRFSKRSISTRLITMYFVSSFVVLASFALVVQYSIKHHFYEQDYQLLYNKFLEMRLNLEEIGADQIDPLAIGVPYFWLVKTGSAPSYSNSILELPEEALLQSSFEWSTGHSSYRSFKFELDNEAYDSVIMALNVNHHNRFISKFNAILLWALIAASCISGIYAVLIVRKGLEPISKLQRYINRVNTNNLNMRIPIDQLPKELAQLVTTQNEMLERLQLGYLRLSEFSSDIAHELRTPLTNIMTQTQVVLGSERTIEEYQSTLASNIEEIERLNKTIADTLYLAKSENQLLHTTRKVLKLESVILPLFEYYEALAEEKDVRLVIKGSGVQLGDKEMLQRAFGNIISNAIRHCDANSTITVAISQDGQFNIVKISNVGEVIPSGSIPLIFDRFYRSDKSRVYTQSVGAGLGLAIAKSIVQAHGGRIDVTSNSELTQFVLSLKNN